MRLSEISKLDDRKRKEAMLGLANNATGAAFGVVGTKAVYDQQKQLSEARRLRDSGLPQRTPEPPKITRLERGLKRLKVKPKYVLPALAATAVGGQVLNAGMDAQSAAYFAGELTPGKNKVGQGAKIKHNDMPKKGTAVDKSIGVFDGYVSKADHTSGVGRAIVEKGWVGRKVEAAVGPTIDRLGETTTRSLKPVGDDLAEGFHTGAKVYAEELPGALAAGVKRSVNENLPKIRHNLTEGIKDAVPHVQSGITRGLGYGLGVGIPAAYGGVKGINAISNAAQRRRERKAKEARAAARAKRVRASRTAQAQVTKAWRTFDAEDDRQRRLGVYQGAGYAAGGAGAVAAVNEARNRGVTLKEIGSHVKRNRNGYLYLTAATGGLTLAEAARRKGKSRTNSRYT